MSKISDLVRPELDRIQKEINRLRAMRIKIGIQGDEDSELLMIAGVHEYGATITAKKAKALTVPISPKAKGKSASDFPDLFVYEADTGNKFLARTLKGGKKKGELECLFWLAPSVTIPERSFIRASYDNGKDTLTVACKSAIDRIVLEGWTAEQAADYVGNIAVGITKRYFESLQPPKSKLTLGVDPSKTAPLMSSGRMRNAITFEVIPA